MLTLYYPPVDAETQWRWNKGKDWIPGLTVGFSLANPTSNFYIGGSNEILIRNIQLVYGIGFQHVPIALGAASSQPIWGGVGAAPTVSVIQGFTRSFFVGLTFNLSSFVQSLGFGASKSP